MARIGFGAALGIAATFGIASAAVAQPPQVTGSVRGIVIDSLLSNGPLAGATIELVELGRVTTSDGRGVFRFDSLPGGRYTISFSHPTLTSIGFSPPDRVIVLGGGIDVSVTLATPAGATIYRRLCPGVQEPKTGMLLGTLTNAVTDSAIPGAEVRGEWSEISVSRVAVASRRPRLIRAIVDLGGRFQLCGIPTDIPVLVRPTAPGVVGPALELRLNDQPFAIRRLTLDRADSTKPATARVTGKVTTNGLPLADAQVLILGTDQVTKTGPDGTFVLGGLKGGTQMIEARAIGFSRQRAEIDVRPAQEVTKSLALTRVATTLPELTVTARSRTRSEFEQRRLTNIGGHFMTRADIVRRGSIRAEDLFRGVPGITIEPVGFNDYRIVSLRGGSGFSTTCEPSVFIDGLRIPLDPEAGLSLPVLPEDIEGIEIHQGPGSAPLQYRAIGQNCGVILIWTRRGLR